MTPNPCPTLLPKIIWAWTNRGRYWRHTEDKTAPAHCRATKYIRVDYNQYITSEWQPIDTAPKDYSPILAVGFTHDGQPVPIVAHWDNGEWKEYSTKQWLTSLTHWMPLPSPPIDNQRGRT